MLRNYTSTVDSTGKEITIISTIMFNPNVTSTIVTMDLYSEIGAKVLRILEMKLDAKETICLDTKLCLSGGQSLRFTGGDIVLSGYEENV